MSPFYIILYFIGGLLALGATYLLGWIMGYNAYMDYYHDYDDGSAINHCDDESCDDE